MPAHIINGLITFISQQLDIAVYDGEVPRTDATSLQHPLNLDILTLPVVKLYMKEDGFNRNWNFEDPYDDTGEILIHVWTKSRDETENFMDQIELLLAQAVSWHSISLLLGGNSVNPYYVIQLLLIKWYSGQEEGVRTNKSELVYRGDMHYECQLHGAVPTS